MIRHALIRDALANALAGVDEIREALPYRVREDTPADLPVASLWRDRTSPPADDRPEFGHYDLIVDWTVRVFIREDSDAESQAVADAITESLYDVFKDGGALEVVSDEYRLDMVIVTDADVEDRGGSPPLLYVNASVVTALTALVTT